METENGLSHWSRSEIPWGKEASALESYHARHWTNYKKVFKLLLLETNSYAELSTWHLLSHILQSHSAQPLLPPLPPFPGNSHIPPLIL